MMRTLFNRIRDYPAKIDCCIGCVTSVIVMHYCSDENQHLNYLLASYGLCLAGRSMVNKLYTGDGSLSPEQVAGMTLGFAVGTSAMYINKT